LTNTVEEIPDLGAGIWARKLLPYGSWFRSAALPASRWVVPRTRPTTRCVPRASA